MNDKITIRVVPKIDELFESCDDCIHSEDSGAICVLRCCVHAIEKLKECYVSKTDKDGET